MSCIVVTADTGHTMRNTKPVSSGDIGHAHATNNATLQLQLRISHLAYIVHRTSYIAQSTSRHLISSHLASSAEPCLICIPSPAHRERFFPFPLMPATKTGLAGCRYCTVLYCTVKHHFPSISGCGTCAVPCRVVPLSVENVMSHICFSDEQLEIFFSLPLEQSGYCFFSFLSRRFCVVLFCSVVA